MSAQTRVDERAVATTPDREIVIRRTLDAPRELVFEVWTDPRHLPHENVAAHHPCGAGTTAATQVRLEPLPPRPPCQDCVPVSVPPFAVSVPLYSVR